MIGYILFGIAMIRTVTLPGWAACQALGVSADLLGFGIAQLVSTAWPIAILRCLSLGAGPAWPDRLWQKPAASNSFNKVDTVMSTGSSDNPIMSPQALLTG
jgi:hypothetical protein